jgi:prevent-host-death family protein
MCSVTVVGLRELRQHASELVRRVEQGEEVTITVAGRPSARLGPVAPQAWRTYVEVSDLFACPADPQWSADRDRVDDVLRDPWSPA